MAVLPAVGDDSGVTEHSTPRSSYLSGSAGNMLRSVLVVFAMVVVLVAIVPRVTQVDQPAVDARSVVVDAVTRSGVAFEYPDGLDEQWKATSARYGPGIDGLETWQAGWYSPQEEVVALKQTAAANAAWLDAATNQGEPMTSGPGQGQVTIEESGRTWLAFVDHRQQISLVATPSDGVATVVSGTGSVDDLRDVISRLRPVPPR